MLTVHVVSHTHWDREWYHPADRFRQRLVALIDELLDDPPAPGVGFLLDGQAVVLEDYLAVRPERASELAQALRSGKLEAGPWFVLADELVPGAEGLVRNLLAGMRTLRAMRADAPPVLYCPDSFGHPAALPELARGFGKSVVIVWRGFGGSRWPAGNAFSWQAPSGERALLYPLTQSGYELGSSLPADPAASRERWRRVRAEFGARSAVDIELLLNGADHHARQRDLPRALAGLTAAAAPDRVEPSSLSAFTRAFEHRAARATLPEVAGELRDSYGHVWTLQGTLATRAPQKRRYVVRERELVRDVEPWTALAAFARGPSRRHLTRAAWRSLLLCQPHDTLCGCSIDAVSRAMEARLESAATQAEGLREDGLFDLIGHDRELARVRQDDWQSVVLVRNRSARARSGMALVEVTMKVADVPVGPGSAPTIRRRATRHRGELLDLSLDHERIESPRAYPDNDAVVRFHAAAWMNDVPAYGIAAVPLRDVGMSAASPPHPVFVKGRSMSNGRLTVRWDGTGRLSVEDHLERRVVGDFLGWESRRDAGDLYTPSIGAPKFKPRLAGTTVLHDGPGTGVVEQLWRFVAGEEGIELRLRVALDAAAPFLRFGILGDNAARDHRLRLVIRTDVARPETVADAAFGPVKRIAVQVPAAERKMETPLATAPLHRYVSVFNAKRGATLYADGLTEYETVNDRIAVTLLRSVGELSRNDLKERPGHAGWPVPTPEAQCMGPFESEFGLLLHGPRSEAVIDEIERIADDVLVPLIGETLRSALALPSPIHGVALEGIGLAFSCAKESEDGEWLVLRCVNLLDREVAGAWRLGRSLSEAKLARLDETALTPLETRGNSVPFLAAPRAVVTMIVR